MSEIFLWINNPINYRISYFFQFRIYPEIQRVYHIFMSLGFFCQIFDIEENFLLYFWCLWHQDRKSHIMFTCWLMFLPKEWPDKQFHICLWNISLRASCKFWMRMSLRWGKRQEGEITRKILIIELYFSKTSPKPLSCR